jgi:hypothetical protein
MRRIPRNGGAAGRGARRRTVTHSSTFYFTRYKIIIKNGNERETVITKRHNLRDNLEDLVTFPLLQPLGPEGVRGSRPKF